jgi:hypothetical protein
MSKTEFMNNKDQLIDLLHELVASGRFIEAKNIAQRIRTNDEPRRGKVLSAS